MATYKTQGIVLKHEPHRENDRFFSIYTLDHGKIQVVGRGTRKIKSKLAPHLNPFSLSDIMVAHGKNFDQVASACLVKDYPRLRSNLGKIIVGSHCLEIVDQLIKVRAKDTAIFLLINEIMEAIDKVEDKSRLMFLKNIFILKLLSHLGYRPELHHCLKCDNKVIPEGNIFSPAKGGLFCAKCSSQAPGDFKPSADTIKLLRLMLDETTERLSKVKLNNALSQGVDRISEAFLKTHLDTILKSEMMVKLLIPNY